MPLAYLATFVGAERNHIALISQYLVYVSTANSNCDSQYNALRYGKHPMQLE